jgi:hypothetical protein
VRETAAANPTFASTIDVATSTEGREVLGLKIATGGAKKSVWVDCVIHAREWLSAPVCMRLIEDLVANSEYRSKVDWYILPIANPDGYSYTWSNVSIFYRRRCENLYIYTYTPQYDFCLIHSFNRVFSLLPNLIITNQILISYLERYKLVLTHYWHSWHRVLLYFEIVIEVLFHFRTVCGGKHVDQIKVPIALELIPTGISTIIGIVSIH